MQWGSNMNALGRQDQKAIATETTAVEIMNPSPTRLDCPAHTSAASENNRGEVARSDRTWLPRGEVLLKNETHAKSNVASEVARIAIKVKGRVLFVDPIDVVVAKAQGNYVALVHKSGSYLVRETMASAEHKLTPLGFVRIHRSILVNTNLAKDLRRDHTGTYVLRTTDGSEHSVGRTYKDNLKVIARSWLGVELV
jgi:DNA-binding LytR/AlgR family response regulator